MQMGVYRGNNVPCSSTTCGQTDLAQWPQPTAAGDYTGDGRVNVHDVVAFMNAYASGRADVNGDGRTDAADVTLFMSNVGAAR
jgi:hypothetical protein